MLDFVPNPNLLSALQDLAGFNLQGRQVGGRKVITLRGMESRHSLILVDGRRISATDEVVGHSDFQYNWVPFSAIEQIEVIRGPMSALYGMGTPARHLTSPRNIRTSSVASVTGTSGGGLL